MGGNDTGDKSPCVEVDSVQASRMGKLYAALSKAQAGYAEAEKDKTGITNDGKYFQYPSKASLIKATRQALAENSLAVIQITKSVNGEHWAHTSLCHESGTSIESVMKLAKMNDPRELGETLSYLFRFAYRDITGVATDEHDLDGFAGEQDDLGQRFPQQQSRPVPRNDDHQEESNFEEEILALSASWVNSMEYDEAVANLESMYTLTPETLEKIKMQFLEQCYECGN